MYRKFVTLPVSHPLTSWLNDVPYNMFASVVTFEVFHVPIWPSNAVAR